MNYHAQSLRGIDTIDLGQYFLSFNWKSQSAMITTEKQQALLRQQCLSTLCCQHCLQNVFFPQEGLSLLPLLDVKLPYL